MNKKNGRFYGALTGLLLIVSLAAGTLAETPPVETRRANTDYQPAFAGQTRAPGMKTNETYRVDILTQDLDKPWALAALPDGRLAITEKDGTMRLYRTDGALSGKIVGFPQVESGGQGGLLDLLPAQDFQASRILYFSLAEKTAEGSLTAVGRGRLSDDETRIEDFRVLYRAYPYYNVGAHFGSRLAWGKDGSLFVSTGDRQSAGTRAMAQDPSSGYGKIIRLSPEGQAETYSLGHRNVQGMAVHPLTQELWASEMGPRGGDEINLILPGKNYGWPVISYGNEYSGRRIGDGLTRLEGMEQPVYYWDSVLAPSGMSFYASEAISEWQYDLFVGGLAGQHISRLKIRDGRVIGEERLLENENQRFRDLAEGLDGALYAVTDGGRLYRIGP